MPWTTTKTLEMSASRTRLFPQKKVPSVAALLQSAGGVTVGPILSAAKLKALLLADGNSARKWKALDLSNSKIRKIELSLGEVAALDFECLTHLDLNGNLLVLLDGHSLPFPHLQALRASNCRINTITNFGSHFRLRQLDISGNHLTSIINLSNTPLRLTLRELNLARNRISDFKGLAPLSTFKSLEVLDLRQNPICNFGNVAEGFALICCTTLRQLNGHTVSPGVREAVDSWALNEACGRATAATVEAFRETLEHPEGSSVLCSTSSPSASGRFNKVRSVRAGPELPYTSTADASVSSDTAACDAAHLKGHALREQDCCSAHSYSCLHSKSNRGLRTVMTRAVSAAVQAAAGEPRNRPVDDSCSFSDAEAATASCATQQSEETEALFQACAVGDSKQRSTKCHRDDLPGTRDTASLLLEHRNGMVETDSQLEGVLSELCKLSLRQTTLESQYFHSTSTYDAHTKATSSSERNSARKERPKRCTGTQTPDGWIRPLELPSDSSSSEGVGKCDGMNGEEGCCRKSLETQSAYAAPAASPTAGERREDSHIAVLEGDITDEEADEPTLSIKEENTESDGACKRHEEPETASLCESE